MAGSYTELSKDMFHDDVLEEIEAVKQIYDGQVSSALVNESLITLTLSTRQILIIFDLNDKYPDEVPSIKILSYIGEEMKLLQQLEICANENIGNPMLYSLLSTTLDIVSEVAKELKKKDESKIQCRFFNEGKCRFGSKCFNLHEDITLSTKSEPKKNETRVVETKQLNQQQETIDDRVKKSSKNSKEKNKQLKTEPNYTKKKSSMKTAMDVINRILWDESFPTEHFVVGYLDRFLGVQEKPFSAFSWEDIASVDYNVLAIPKHRIQYFKYKTVTIWDKNERLDLVFGSTGNDVSIMEVIENESAKPENETLVKEDQLDYDIDNDEPSKFASVNRPNYFFALRVSDDEVKENVVEIQNSITYYDDRLQSLAHPPSVFHITLCMMRLNNEGDFIRAGSVLKSLERILVCMHPQNKSFLTLKGITDFRGQAVIAKVLSNPLFNKFVQIAMLKLKDAGIKLVGNHEPYSAHLTILKLNRPFCRENKMEIIDPAYYKSFSDSFIGTQVINDLRLCSTGKERDDDDFYVTISKISNSLLNINSALPYLISLHIQNLMGAGFILEDEGDIMLAEVLSEDPVRFERIVETLEILLESFTNFYQRNKRHVIIMRGLPGSGKSYFVKGLEKNCKDRNIGVCSADQYFEEREIGYKFDEHEISSAHFACQDKFIDFISKKLDIIIVDNTHLQKWEYQIYQRIALLCGYTSHVVSTNPGSEASHKEFYNRCTHKFKPHVFKDMVNKFENDDDAICINNSDTVASIHNLINYGSLFPFTPSSMLYTALYLDDESCNRLQSLYPPVHENISCNHVTLIYAPTMADITKTNVGDVRKIKVTGYIVNDCVQAVLVSDDLDIVNAGDNEKEHKQHITISTNKDTPPKDVDYWTHYLPCLPPTEPIFLTGTVGVQIASSKTNSFKCIDPEQFLSIIDQIHGSVVEKDEGSESGSSSEDDLEEVELYFGRDDAIKSLYVFDFDGTLFHTPDPANGRAKYQKVTGHRWPHKGWLGQSDSLRHPLHIYPGPSLRDYFEHCERACSKTVLLTGRMEKVREGLQPVLDMHGLKFDEVILKPMYEGITVHSYKKDTVKDLMKNLPHIKEVKFWDDRVDNIKQIDSLQKTLKDINIETFHVDATTPNLETMTLPCLLDRMGIRPNREFHAAVEHGLKYLTKICKDALGITNDVDILHPFGSYLLKRKSDVDVCVFAQKNLNVDQCLAKIGEKAKAYGIEYVYVASGIRCPVIKLKLRFMDLPPIEFDLVLACVLETDFEDDMDIENIYQNCTDLKSKVALDGILFFEKVVSPVLDRLDIDDFGMVIDVMNLILKRNFLKGNVFHCIRSFHIVKLLAKFILSFSSVEILPLEGWQNVKEFEKFILHFLEYLSEISVEDYKKLFKGFVPDIYIKPMCQYFFEASRLTLLDILFNAPQAKMSECNVRFSLSCKDPVRLWFEKCSFEAKLGSCVRKLIQNHGVSIEPGVNFNNTITFNVTPLDVCRGVLTDFKKSLIDTLPSDVILKLTLK